MSSLASSTSGNGGATIPSSSSHGGYRRMGWNKKRFSRKTAGGSTDGWRKGKWVWVFAGVMGGLLLMVGMLTCALLVLSVQRSTGQELIQGPGLASRQELTQGQGLVKELTPENFMLAMKSSKKIGDGMLSSLASTLSSLSSSTSPLPSSSSSSSSSDSMVTMTVTDSTATTTTTNIASTTNTENDKSDVIDVVNNIDKLSVQPVAIQSLPITTTTTTTMKIAEEQEIVTDQSTSQINTQSSQSVVPSLLSKDDGIVVEGIEDVFEGVSTTATPTPSPTHLLLPAANEIERNTTTLSTFIHPPNAVTPTPTNTSIPIFPQLYVYSERKGTYHRYPVNPTPRVFYATLELSSFLRMGERAMHTRKQQQQPQQPSLPQEDEILLYLKEFYLGIVA